MKSIRNIAAVLVLVLVASACKRIEVGYLSDNLRYGQNPIEVSQGVFYIANGITPDNSTPPLKVTLLNIKNKVTGVREEAFFKEYEIDVWKEPYNPLTDTTLAIIESKRAKEKKLPVIVLEKSGQFLFTQASANVPPGEYLADVQVENQSGSKVYNDAVQINLTEVKEYEYINAPYFTAVEVVNGKEENKRFYLDNVWLDESKGQSTNTTLTITRIADSPNQIVLKAYDKDGAVFPGEAFETRPSGNSSLKNLSTFAYKTTVTKDAVLYDYAQTRFPDVYWDSQSNNTHCYYRIYDKWIESIDYADQANWNPPASTPYLTYNNSVILNIRFNTLINKPGKYLYELKLKVKKKP